MTVRLTVCVFAAGAPKVVAEIVIGVVPKGVLAAAVKVSVTLAGNADTEAEGEKLQVTPAGIPLAGQASVTFPLKARTGHRKADASRRAALLRRHTRRRRRSQRKIHHLQRHRCVMRGNARIAAHDVYVEQIVLYQSSRANRKCGPGSGWRHT